MKYIFLSLLIPLLAACHMKPDQEVSYYYNIDSLLAAQEKLLIENGAVLNKHAIIGNDSSQNTIRHDDLKSWKKEFEIFDDININKPTLKGVYRVNDYADKDSNLQVREYVSGKKDTEIKFLKIFYLKNVKSLHKIEAKYVEDNPIYHTERNLTFIFDDIKGQPTLWQYNIEGIQKMILKDTVKFNIYSELVF